MALLRTREKLMPDYKKSKIYKLESKSGLIYIGSTTQTLSNRKAGHIQSYKRWLNGGYGYTTSFDLFEKDGFCVDIVLIEDFPCERKEQLHKREGEICKQYTCVNKNIAGRNDKQYRDDKKLEINIRNKIYRQKNNDRIKAFKNRKYKCACGGKYTHSHKSLHCKMQKHVIFDTFVNHCKNHDLQLYEAIQRHIKILHYPKILKLNYV